MPSPTASSWTLLICLGLIWGASFPAVELALMGFQPLSIAAFRIALAAIAILILTFAIGVGLPPINTRTGRRIWLHAAGMGILSNALPFSLLSWGQQHVTSGFAGITMAGLPLLVLPLAHFLVPGERMTARKVIGFVVGFLGVVVLIGPARIAEGGADALARLACVGAVVCYACGSIVTRRAPQGPLLSFSAAALLVATLILLPLAVTIDGRPTQVPGPALAGVIYLGLLPTALATLMLVHIIKTAGPSFLSLVNYQVPVWAVILGTVFLNEPLPAQLLVALALILGGLVIAQTRAPRFRP